MSSVKSGKLIKLGRLLLITLLLLSLNLLAAGCGQEEAPPEPPAEPVIEPEPEPEPEPIYNPLTGLEVEAEIEARVLAVSIDNHPEARPQSGTSQADIVYEIPAEGGIPRLVALFYSQQPDNIGPVRSARPYAIDIARGWEALFVHCGYSPAAKLYLAGPEVFSINEIAYGSYFWRDYSLHKNEHTLYTSSEKLYEYIEYREKPLTQEVSFLPFRYGEEGEAPLPQEKADWLHVKYDHADNYYLYDQDSGRYNRYIGETACLDANNDQQLAPANVIIQRVSSRVLDSYGRLEIDMCAGGEALLFSQGRVTVGTWSRASLDSNTEYAGLDGQPFLLAPGQTWVEICDGKVRVEYRDTTAPPPEEAPARP